MKNNIILKTKLIKTDRNSTFRDSESLLGRTIASSYRKDVATIRIPATLTYTE